jgi:hypothetical protein
MCQLDYLCINFFSVTTRIVRKARQRGCIACKASGGKKVQRPLGAHTATLALVSKAASTLDELKRGRLNIWVCQNLLSLLAPTSFLTRPNTRTLFNLTSSNPTNPLLHTYYSLRRTRCRRRSLSSKLTAGGAVNVAPFRSGLCTANRF